MPLAQHATFRDFGFVQYQVLSDAKENDATNQATLSAHGSAAGE
jgi:hypothetical protein